MGETSSSSSVGIGFPGLLTLLFIALKLTGYITWSWWWVWSPMLSTASFIILAFIVMLILAIVFD